MRTCNRLGSSRPVLTKARAFECRRALTPSLHEETYSKQRIARLLRSYDPVRLPPVPPPEATLRPLPSHQTGLPRLPEPPFRRAVPTTPADRAGALVDCFPAHAAFPKWQEGRHPHCHFRGLLRLHSRYGPPDRSAAQRRPLSRGSDLCGYPHEPLVSYRINRQLSGWILPPLMIRAFGAHCHLRTHALQQTNLRGRDASYLAPPAQIRTCGFPAYGSHLGSERQS